VAHGLHVVDASLPILGIVSSAIFFTNSRKKNPALADVPNHFEEIPLGSIAGRAGQARKRVRAQPGGILHLSITSERRSQK
jgi:hypothetical protein